MKDIIQFDEELELLIPDMGPDEIEIMEEIREALAYGELVERFYFDQD